MANLKRFLATSILVLFIAGEFLKIPPPSQKRKKNRRWRRWMWRRFRCSLQFTPGRREVSGKGVCSRCVHWSSSTRGTPATTTTTMAVSVVTDRWDTSLSTEWTGEHSIITWPPRGQSEHTQVIFIENDPRPKNLETTSNHSKYLPT